MAQAYRGQQTKGPVRQPTVASQIFPGASKIKYPATTTLGAGSKYANMNPNVAQIPTGAPIVQPGSLAAFQAQMKNITPGMIQDTHPPAPKVAATAKKTTPSKTAIARRVTGGSGGSGVAAVAAKPVDPLEALRGEYDKYMQDIYGGLTTSLEAERQQYKTRSDELAARLGGVYDDAAKTAGGVADASQNSIAEFAKRMGLESATQGSAVQDWQATNERLKALNSTNRANSVATNDLIRSNYYDFLRDKISSAEGSMATSRAGVNDLVLQAQLARQQAQVAAAQAAARARSSGRRRSGGGGSSSKGTTTAETISSTNDILNQLAQQDPVILNALMANDPVTSSILKAGTKTGPVNAGPWTGGNTSNIHTVTTQTPEYYTKYQPAAFRYLLAAGKTGGPVTKSTTKVK